MELLEEAMGSKDQTQIKKGKRTKRQRPTSPLTLTMASPSSTTAEGGNSGGGECFSDNSGEEEDMANCLILLAQGSSSTHQTRNFSTQIPPATTAKSAGGLYIYECKTCNRCFPSFQALGGHRASHKKPKSTIEEKIKSTLIKQDKEDHKSDNDSTLTLSLQFPNRALSISTNNNKSRVHECSICGAEFTSGQALGGHMRRHRSAISTTINPDHESQLEGNKPRNGLSLDLNLPAPEDDHRESTLIPFASKGQVIVFSASPLVDCHY